MRRFHVRACLCEKKGPPHERKVFAKPFIYGLGAQGIATRSKDATRGSWPYY